MKWILDPGHWGMVWGHYLWPGKQSPMVPPGIYEGEFNRDMCQRIHALDPANTVITVPGPINVPLRARIKFINKLSTVEDCALLSIHANAAGRAGWNEAQGHAVFHSRTPLAASKRLAHTVSTQLERAHYTSSRGVKKANFSIITYGHKRILQAKIPAVLIEYEFMTNRHGAMMLADPDIRHRLAIATVIAMGEFEVSG